MDEFEKRDSQEETQQEEELQAQEQQVEFSAQEPKKPSGEIELEEEEKGKVNVAREIFDWAQAIVVAVVIALFIRTFLFTLVSVKGRSMEPTLHDKDSLIVVRAGYEPEAGDVIIFRPEKHQDTPYVKRVIATEGQEVNINPATGDVYVDGQALEEDYIKEKIRTMYDVKFPVVVPEDCVFVLGDNRNNSSDSRTSSVGMVKNDSIIGKASVRIWPPSGWGTID